MNEYTDKLRLLDDLPVVGDQDRFHHNVYAEMIRDVFLSNAQGLAVGLFGKWGHGKSTVVRILESLLPAEYRTVVFNAWKSRGDAVRRQLLLQVLKHIDSPQYKEISRFVCPGIPLRIRSYMEQQLYREHRIWWLLTTAEKLDFWVIGALLSALVMAFGAIFLFFKALDTPDPHALLLWAIPFIIGLTFSCMTVVFRWFQNRRQALLTSAEPVSDSQRLHYPEQFQTVFEQEVSSFCAQGNKLLVVIDDLDRCDPETIVEALSAVRQFSDQKHIACQFLIPCDEMQVVLALETAGHDAGVSGATFHDYHSEELLRKFFDVVIRMSEMLPDDLSDYAASLCKDVGLNEKECREIVSIAGARDPRQVKKLLNALRISHDSIDRRSGNLLPESNEMPRLAETERLLVALRETVPQAYKEICAHPAYVEEGFPKEDNARTVDEHKLAEFRKANAFIASAGAVSRVTADNLIYGKLERELREVKGGGPLQRAFIYREEVEFSESVSDLRPEDRPKVKAWLLKKARGTSSDAELRDVLRLLLSHCMKDEKEREYMAECVKAALLSTASLEDVLAGFKQFDQLEWMWPILEELEKHAVIAAFHNNFQKDTPKGNPELGFLLRHANQLQPTIAKSLRTWMSGEVKDTTEDDEFVRRLFDIVKGDESQKACSGFAPDVGVALAKKQEWLDDQDEETKEDHKKWPRSHLVTLLIGNNSRAAWEAITAIFGPQGQLASPSQLHKTPPGAMPAWRAIGKLTKVVGSEKASDLFTHFQKWLTPQGEVQGAKVVLDALAPVIFSLGDSHSEALGDYLAKLLWAQPAELWLFEYVGKKPRGKEKAEQWTILSQRVFQQLSNSMRAPAALNDPQKQLLAKVTEMAWVVPEKADDLLGFKLKQLPPNGNTQQAEAWVACLAPLLGPNLPHSSEAIRELLRSRQSINEALRAGKTVLWAEQIDSEDATVIANMCVKLGNQLPTYQDALSSLMGIQGSGRIVELCVDLLNDDQNWLKGQIHLLTFIAKSSEVAEKATQQGFQGKIKRLIISDDDATVIVGLSVLKECTEIGSAVMKEVKLREKSENDQIRELAEIVRAKKTLR